MMTLLIFQMGTGHILGMEGFILGLLSLFLFLPFICVLPGPKEIVHIVTWILIPVYWYLMACTLVVLDKDKKIRDWKYGRK